ncbi:flagellin lysine-N-methylase [Blautia obeum]|mgnify:FL=1|uniref:Flagellar biosynthetic protein fliU n=1 Tax=Blautia obeum TaxID=40520 RepID=A0A173YN70_9FIRM|nr:flagellin lysine-N-methylase [Blautia obeum]CUN65572.1 Flagellar biosynthetic protein fliU [Blautia obeum]
MEFTFPNYYKEFSCIAGSCPDTCCAGWQIVIDNKTLKKYQHFKGPFHNRLHNDIDWKEHVFRQYNRRCAFLNEENLCDIYTEAGPKMLCDTCRNYPRHIEEFEGLREISLSLSCPEAARILLSQKEKVHSRMNTSDTSKDLFKNMWKTIVPEMEVLRPGWKEFLKERLDSLYISSGENDYIYQKSEFDFYCPDWQIQEEQLLVYWIYTYFCGAVYDDEIFTKVKMAVVCTLFIHELDVGTYLKNEHHFNLNAQIQICYQFSRELEHSDLNLNKFQELMSENNIFSFENLLKIC